MSTPKACQPVALTTTRIAALGTPAERIEIRDATQPGLRLRISPQGTRSWVWLKKVGGKTQRVTLGRYPDIDIASARKAAAKMAGDVAMGANPAKERKQARVTAMTLAAAYHDYIAAKRLRASTLVDYAGHFDKLAPLHGKPVSEISRDDVERLHRKISAHSKSRADGTMRVLRAIINRAIDRVEDAGGPSFTNPVRRLSSQGLWNKTQRKQTRIARADLPAFVGAVRSDGALTASDLTLTLLATGWRLGETRRLRWSEVDLANGFVTLRAEETKSGRRAVLPIPLQVQAILKFRHAKRRANATYVFEQRGQPIRSAKALLARIEAATGIRATHHDLRRTFASMADAMGVGDYTIKRLVNHATDSRDVTAGYVSADAEDLRKAQQLTAEALLGPMA
jgi:integrase